MDKVVETIKGITRKRLLTAAEVTDLITACQEAARLFTILIEEEGSTKEAPKIKYLRDEVRRTHQQVLTQKEPALPEDLVRRVEACIEQFNVVAAKQPTKKRPATASPHPKPQTSAAEDDSHHVTPQLLLSQNQGDGDAGDEEEEEELDSEEEFLLATRAARKAHMGDAAWHVRLLHFLTFCVLVLACTGVIFSSRIQYEEALLAEQTAAVHTAHKIALDAVDIVELMLPTAASNFTNACEDLFASMGTLRTGGATQPPFYFNPRTPFHEVQSIRFSFSESASTRTFTRVQNRKFELICLQAPAGPVIAPNDLQYGAVWSVPLLTARVCNSQATGAAIWSKTTTMFRTFYEAAPSYRGTQAMQLAVERPVPGGAGGEGIGVEFQMETAPAQESADPFEWRSGSYNPLRYPWQQSTAMWSAFAIGIAMIAFIAASEFALAASRDEVLSDTSAVAIYGGVVAVGSLIVVMTCASISWSFLSDSLREQQQHLVDMQAKLVASAAGAPSLQRISGAPLAFLALAAQSSLNRSLAYFDPSGVLRPSGNAAVSVAAQLTNFAGLRLSSESHQAGSIDGKKTSLLFSNYGVTGIPSPFSVSVYREVDSSYVIYDAGRRAAGPALGVMTAQLLLIAVYFLVTPLLQLLPYGYGAVWLEQHLRPEAFRYLLYAAVVVFTFGTSLAVAFYAVGRATQWNAEVASPKTGLSVVQALAALSTAAAATATSIHLNAGLPSFADALAMDMSSGTALPTFAAVPDARFPVPTWVGWESNFYGGGLGLSNFTTCLSAPAYYAPLAKPSWSGADLNGVRYVQTCATPVDDAGLHSVVLQRDASSYESVPMVAYRVYASFVFAALLASAVAITLLDYLFRVAEGYRSREREGAVRIAAMVMVATMLLPAFSVLIGAGGASTSLTDANEQFVQDELAWGVRSVKPLLGAVAQAAVATNGAANSSAVFTVLAEVVARMNARACSLPFYSRWVLLSEVVDGTLSRVTVVQGGDASATFVTPLLTPDSAATVMHTELWSTAYDSVNATRRVAGAITEIITGLDELTTASPGIYVMLAVDQNEMLLGQRNVNRQVFQVAGTCVVALALLLWLLLWFVLRAADDQDFLVMNDDDELLPLFPPGDENIATVSPPAIPRTWRISHVVASLAFVAALVFLFVSLTYGSQVAKRVVEAPIAVSTMREAIVNAVIYPHMGNAWAYVITTLSAPLTALQTFLSTSTASRMAGVLAINDTTISALRSAMTSAAKVSSTASHLSSEFVDESLVQSLQETYHAATMAALDPLPESEYATAIAPIESIYSAMSLVLAALQNSYPLAPTTFNATAMVSLAFSLARMRDVVTKALILERIAVNTFLNFGGSTTTTTSTSTSGDVFFLAGNDAFAVKTAVGLLQANLTAALATTVADAQQHAASAFPGYSQQRNIVRNALSSVASTAASISALSDPRNALWTWQAARVVELQTAINGDGGALQNAMAASAAIVSAAASAADAAATWELNYRRQKDYDDHSARLGLVDVGGESASSVGAPFFSLTGWSLGEKLQVLRDVNSVLVTAVATTVLSLVLVAVFYAAFSWMSFSRLIAAVRRRESLLRAGGADDEDDDDQSESQRSLMLQSELSLHWQQHVQTLRRFLWVVLLATIPVGMAYWAVSSSIDDAAALAIEGDAAATLAAVAENLPAAQHRLLYDTAAKLALGDGPAAMQSLRKFQRSLILLGATAVRKHRAELRKLQRNEGVNFGRFSDAAYLSRMTMLRAILQGMNTTLQAVVSNATAEAAAAVTSRASSNASTVLLSLQLVAAAYAIPLKNATSVADQEAVLAPISPFGASLLADFVHSEHQYTLGNATAFDSCTTTSTLAACNVSSLAASLSTFIAMLQNASLVPKAHLDFWSLQTSASKRNNSEALRRHSDFTPVSSSWLAGTSFPTSVQQNISQTYTTLVAATTPYPSSTQTVFATTPVIPTSNNWAASTLGYQLNAPASVVTYESTRRTRSSFQQQFAFNRKLLPTAAKTAAAAVLYGQTSLSDNLATLQDQVAQLTSRVDLLELPVATVIESGSTNQVNDRVVLIAQPSPYGMNNAEYVSVSVQWACVVALWIGAVATAWLVSSTKVLFM